MAAVIVENGYPYPGDTDITSIEIGGVTYENLSVHKPYVSDGGVYSNPSWTDTDENGGVIGKFTDGLAAVGDGGSGECGCYTGSNTSVTIDLGAVSAIKQVSTDLFGNTSWGIPSTADSTVKLFVSVDGENFQEVGEIPGGDMRVNGGWDMRDYVLTLDESVDARYVKLQYSIDGNFLWVSEISVYGTSGENGDVSEIPDESESPDTSDESVTSDASVAVSEPASSDNGGNTGYMVAVGAVLLGALASLTAVFTRKKK